MLCVAGKSDVSVCVCCVVWGLSASQGDEAVIGYLRYCREQGYDYKTEIEDQLQVPHTTSTQQQQHRQTRCQGAGPDCSVVLCGVGWAIHVQGACGGADREGRTGEGGTARRKARTQVRPTHNQPITHHMLDETFFMPGIESQCQGVRGV